MSKTERIWHPYWLWEDHKHGFYETSPKDMSKQEGEEKYVEFFTQEGLFEKTLIEVLEKWPYACEHNFTNPNLNKIAYAGQIAICYAWGIPGNCRAGYSLLTKEQQVKNDKIAEKILKKWFKEKGYEYA